MSEQAGSGKAPETSQVVLEKIYIKDLSYESPNPAQIFAKLPANPEINLQLGTTTHKLTDEAYEVVLNLTITAKMAESDSLLYRLELKQAGLFTLAHFGQQELEVMVSTFCPNILFPYARETVSAVVEKGGFPQLLLAPINFEALYQQHLAKIRTASPEASSDAKH